MEAEASSRRPLLFGVVSMMARNRRKIPPRSPVKPVVRPVLPLSGGHLVQDRPAVGPAGLLVPARQQIIVTAQLHVPPGRPDHVPHQWVKPMDAPDTGQQEQIACIPPLQVGQLVGQGGLPSPLLQSLRQKDHRVGKAQQQGGACLGAAVQGRLFPAARLLPGPPSAARSSPPPGVLHRSSRRRPSP